MPARSRSGHQQRILWTRASYTSEREEWRRDGGRPSGVIRSHGVLERARRVQRVENEGRKDGRTISKSKDIIEDHIRRLNCAPDERMRRCQNYVKSSFRAFRSRLFDLFRRTDRVQDSCL
ncbi:hypothetical protein J6590_021004 [Homalodisca vitripennis]|nr:hypothetical protein J6590_021004 [Homalodisca vitripennis]